MRRSCSRPRRPALAKSTHTSLKLFPQLGQASRCVSHNLVPTGDTVVDDAGGAYPFSTGQPNYREFFYGAVELSGREPGLRRQRPLRPLPGGRRPARSCRMPNPATATFQAQSLWAHNISAPLGTRPRLPAGGQPPVPDGRALLHAAGARLNGPAGAVGPPTPKAVP